MHRSISTSVPAQRSKPSVSASGGADSRLSLGRFRVLLLDMHSTFMFGEDRFGPGEDFAETYARLGGQALSATDVQRHVRATYDYLEQRASDPLFEDAFPSLREALAAAAPGVASAEGARLARVFAQHECGQVSPEYAAMLRALAQTHELRLVSNIWAPRDAWLAELDRAGVLSLFERTVFSSDGRSLKPSHALFEKALENLPCGRSEVLMIGDSLHADMRGGRRVGIATLWLNPSGRPLDAESAAWVDFQGPSLLSIGAPLPAGGNGRSPRVG